MKKSKKTQKTQQYNHKIFISPSLKVKMERQLQLIDVKCYVDIQYCWLYGSVTPRNILNTCPILRFFKGSNKPSDSTIISMLRIATLAVHPCGMDGWVQVPCLGVL